MTDNPLVVNLTHGSRVVLERQRTYVALSVSGVVILTHDEARRIGHWLIAGPAPSSPCVHCARSLASCLAAACCDSCQYQGRRHSHPQRPDECRYEMRCEPLPPQQSSGGPNDHR